MDAHKRLLALRVARALRAAVKTRPQGTNRLGETPRAHAHHGAVVHGDARGRRGRFVPVRTEVTEQGDVRVQQVRQRRRNEGENRRQGFGIQAGYDEWWGRRGPGR